MLTTCHLWFEAFCTIFKNKKNSGIWSGVLKTLDKTNKRKKNHKSVVNVGSLENKKKLQQAKSYLPVSNWFVNIRNYAKAVILQNQ